MDRREAISRVAFLLGGTVVGADLLVSCAPKAKKENMLFDQDQVSFLDEVGDTILPATKTPGAKAANIGNFMALMVQDCYSVENQEIFLKGIGQINEASHKNYGKDFMNLDAPQRTALLTRLDKEQRDYMRHKKWKEPAHYFRMMKELTLLGYFTSEVGATKALRYVAVPGRYDGCISYKKGDKAWA
jgi:hypothetical protein